jgi:hypothetical protein
MPVKYENVIPWGRSFEEYCAMFRLTHQDLSLRILGCADGPADFNAGMHRKGFRVISADPVYRFSAAEIRERIHATGQLVLEQTRSNMDSYVWTSIGSPEDLWQRRMSAMESFLEDYEKGRAEGRYICAELPDLELSGDFDLILCSHFLFLYSDRLSLDFHIQSLHRLCLLAPEVRIFPLLDVSSRRSAYVDKVVEHFTARGWIAEELKVDYEFQKNGNTMLKLRKEPSTE